MLCLILTPLAFATSTQGGTPPLQDFEYRKSSSYPEFPIVGTWTYKAPESTCEDTYTFQADGTMRGTSGEQVVDSKYTISEKHTQYAFYALKHQIITTNGKKDCEGKLSEVGYEGLHFIRYDVSGEHMLMCEDEMSMLYNCFGPMTRQK